MNCFISLRWGAGLLALALSASAACGSIPDAPGANQDGGGGPDAMPRMGKASLVAHHDDQSPVAGATVVLTSGDGTLKLETVTGSDGKIELDITDGDIASVGWTESLAGATSRKLLYTVLDLQVGDVVNLNNRTSRPSDTIGDMVIMSQPLPPGATSATIDIGCTSSKITNATQVATTMQLRKDCVDSGGKFSVVADALNANGLVVASAVKLDLAAQAGQTVILPAWASPGSTRVSFALTNAPAGAKATFGNLEGLRHGIGYESFQFNGIPANPGSISVAPAKGYIDAITRSAAVLFPKAGDATITDGVIFLISKEAYVNDPGATYTADLSKAMPRLYESTYASASHTFTWKVQAADATQTTNLRNADIAAISLPWSDPGAPTNQQNLWVVMGPGSVDSPLQLDLHTLTSLAPAASAGPLPASVQVLELDVVDGYADAKTRFGSNFLDSVDSLPQFNGMATFSGELH